MEFISSGIGGEIKDTEVYSRGDTGHKVGGYVITDPGGTTIDVGKYIEVWRHADGKGCTKFNSDLSLPGSIAGTSPETARS